MNQPIILEKSSQRLTGLDLASKLMQERIIMLDEEITDHFANQVIIQLLYLKSTSKDPITIFINGPGGSVYDGLGIYDMIESCKKDGIIIKTRGIGFACSMQSFLLSAGTKGERKVYPNCTIMIHQPSGGTRGQVTDIIITANEALRLKELLTNEYIKNGAVDSIREMMERDCWLNAEKAIELGLIDGIL